LERQSVAGGKLRNARNVDDGNSFLHEASHDGVGRALGRDRVQPRHEQLLADVSANGGRTTAHVDVGGDRLVPSMFVVKVHPLLDSFWQRARLDVGKLRALDSSV